MDRAKKRFQLYLDAYKEVYDEISIEFMGEHYATTIALKENLTEILDNKEKKMLDRLFKLLDAEGKGAVSEEDFYSVMRPWASFSATDINGDGELDSSELKTLIWLMNEEEPTEFRVKRDMEAIDVDGSGFIDREEWIQYLASPDPESGQDSFNLSLKRQFDFHDSDKDGLISTDDLYLLIKETLEEITKGKSQETKKIIDTLEKAMAQHIMGKLDTNKSGTLDWG